MMSRWDIVVAVADAAAGAAAAGCVLDEEED